MSDAQEREETEKFLPRYDSESMMELPLELAELKHRIRVKVAIEGVSGLLKAVPRNALGSVLAFPLRLRDDDEFLDASRVRNDSASATGFTELGEPWTVSFPPEVRHLIDRPRTVSNPRPFVAEFSGVTLLGTDGIIVLDDNRVLLYGRLEWKGRERLHDAVQGVVRSEGLGAVRTLSPLHGREWGRTSRSAESGFSMIGPLADTYYHWTIEYLPLLQRYEEFRSQTNADPPLVLSADRPSFVDESLDILGYEPAEHLIHGQGRSRIGRFFYPSPVWGENSAGVPSPAGCSWLRDRMVRNVDSAQYAPSPNRIFISRRDTRERRVVNEDGLIDALEEFGFETVVPSELPLAKQVAWFSQADVVVGPHGGGLTNIVYGDELTVVELFGDRFLPHYFGIASVLGFDYDFVRGDSVNGIDISIDVDEVVETLESLGVERE